MTKLTNIKYFDKKKCVIKNNKKLVCYKMSKINKIL